jgi:hypothetical protein
VVVVVVVVVVGVVVVVVVAAAAVHPSLSLPYIAAHSLLCFHSVPSQSAH